MFRRTDKVPWPPPAYLGVDVVVVLSDDNYAVADINGKSEYQIFSVTFPDLTVETCVLISITWWPAKK